MPFVYILGASTPRGPISYVGWTLDLERRLAQHVQRRRRDLGPDAVARHDDKVRAVGHGGGSVISGEPTIVAVPSQMTAKERLAGC